MPTILITETEKSILENQKIPQMAKVILSKKNNTRRITVPALRHKVVMIKTAWN